MDDRDERYWSLLRNLQMKEEQVAQLDKLIYAWCHAEYVSCMFMMALEAAYAARS